MFVPFREARLRLSTRQFVSQFGQFDLELCLARLGPLTEYFEDERKPVDDLDTLGQQLTEVVGLVRPEPVVEDDGRRLRFRDRRGEVFSFPFTQLERRVRAP